MRTNTDSICSTVYGLICAFGAAVIGLVWLSNHRAIELHGAGMRDLSPLKWPVVFLAFLGVALLLRWKTALLIFVTVTAAVGTFLVVISVWQSIAGTPWVLLNIPLGAILLIPISLFVHFWRASRTSLAHGH